jgi:PAS domain S-box-containing protein
MNQPENSPMSFRSDGPSRALRKRAESLLNKAGKDVDTVLWGDIKALVHELQVHQVELEFQNVELREAESKLSESRDHYSDLYDFAPVGYLTIEADTKIIEANLTTAKMLGVNRGDLISSKFSDFVDRDAQDELYIFRRKVFASKKVSNCELLIRRADGTTRNVRLQCAAASTTTSGKASCHAALIDITSEKEAEEELRIQEDWNHAILNAAVDVIITIDQQGVIVAANPATEKIFGYSPAEMEGQNLSMLMPSPDRKKHDGYLANYQKTGADHVIGVGREVTGRRKDGSTFPADLAVGEADQMGYYTGIIRDISFRSRMKEEARKKHDFSESLIEATQSIILVLDCEGRVVRYNKVLEQISGRSLVECEGSDWFETFLPVEDQSQVRELFRSAALVSPTSTNINPIVTTLGRLRKIEWQSAPLRDAEGSVIGIVCSGTDVTDRLLLEQEVFRASEEEKVCIAQDLHDGLGSLLIGISYLFASMVEDLRRGKAVEAKAIKRVTDSLAEANDQARDLAHGLIGISDQPNALPGAIKRLIDWVRSTSNLACRFKAPSDIIMITNTVIGNHVFRIAQEAVNNAIRHSGAKLLTLRIKPLEDGRFALTVLDNGSGFDLEKLSDRGIGLRTMQYRAHAIGAMLRIKRRKKGGTRVECLFSNRLGPETP